MRILYAIQGTGNGHISRAKELIPHLKQIGKLDLLISGFQADLDLSHEVRYKSKGISFVFGKSGGVDLLNTIKQNRLQRVLKEIREFPITDYDLVINDFEPISAYAAQQKRVLCIGLSHQAALLSSMVPRPESTEYMGKWILENFAPADLNYGFHFKSYDRQIFTPVIRSEILNSEPTLGDHFTVYLPAFGDEKLIKVLGNERFRDVKWHIFSKHSRRNYKVNNITVLTIDSELFAKSMISSRGVICGAGFETPAEALALNKPLMVVPMKNQYEQSYNAEALKELGVPVITKFGKGTLQELKNWVDRSESLNIHFPDIAGDVVDQVMLKAERIIKNEREFLLQV